MDWRATITDAKERKVFAALDQPDVTWRTIAGIARATGLSEAEVEEILKRHDPSMTCFSAAPSVSGSALVGLVERVGA